MKIKYIGNRPVKNLDLVFFQILEPTDEIYPGEIIEIPDDKTDLINRMKVNGNYEVYNEPKKTVKPTVKKESKPKKDKKDKKEDK